MSSYERIIKTEGYWIVKIQNDFYRAAKSVRDKYGSQKKLAELTGKSESRISQILHGDFNARLSTLVEYSLALGYVPVLDFVKIDDFLNGERMRIAKKKLALDELRTTTSFSPDNAVEISLSEMDTHLV